MKKIQIFILATALLFAACIAPDHLRANGTEQMDQKRNRLIGYILSRQLPAMHFSDKLFDAELDRAAFHLYIKQLDFQKRFLLNADVRQLEAFAPYIGESLTSGRITLPDTGYDILFEKITQVEKMVEEMLAAEQVEPASAAAFVPHPGNRSSTEEEVRRVGIFSVAQEELHETDPEKLDFVENMAELRERWRMILQSQIISQYLDLRADQESVPEKEEGAEAAEPAELKTNGELWQEALVKVRKRNRSFFQRLRQETLQDHYDRFFNSVARAFDPHTNYIPPASKEQFDINMRGSLEGIGALLREDDGLIKVIRIIPGSASARQGRLKAEDIILQVAQQGEEPVDITDMRLRDAVRLIRGPKGETVSLTIQKPDGTTDTISIIRDVVQIEETFVKSTVYQSPDGRRTGYIHIPSFYRDFEGSRGGAEARNSTDDTRREVLRLREQNVDGIILDLRDDGGGALVDAVDITGLFIDSGPVVQVLNSFGERRVLEDNDTTVAYDGPLVVLVNKFSASASEIVAAALQDYGRAVIVGGTHTHGKGTVQTIIDLNENVPLLHLRKYDDLGALKVMIQKFYRVNGSSTQYKGVEPDIVLPDLFEHLKAGERYLDYSLPWDAIDPVEFTLWGGPPLDIDRLRRQSLARVAGDEGLQAIQEESLKAEQRSADTRMAIDLGGMRQKREEARQVREKIGNHYRKYREEGGDELEEFPEPEEEGDDPGQAWLKNVQEDPYVREAVRIIGDIIALSGR
jgi:carboxyl-terminal processing protease